MFGKRYSDEEKEEISKKLLGKKNTIEHNKKISNSLKNKPKTEIHKRNLSISHMSKIPTNTKPYKVINIHTNEIMEFISGTEMEKQLHCSRKTIDKGKITKNGPKKYIEE